MRNTASPAWDFFLTGADGFLVDAAFVGAATGIADFCQGGVDGVADLGGNGRLEIISLPHLWQKRALSGTSVPQAGQVRGTISLPHLGQKRARSGISDLQNWQIFCAINYLTTGIQMLNYCPALRYFGSM